MNARTISAIIFFALLATLLALTYWPNIPDIKIRMRGDWVRMDYIGHLGFYAATVFSFLLWQAGWRKRINLMLLLLTLLGGLALGVLTEYTQLLIPGRSFNPLDMLYSCTGVVIGVACSWIPGKWRQGDREKRGNDVTLKH